MSKSVSKTHNQQVVLTKDEVFFKELFKTLFKEIHKAGGPRAIGWRGPTKTHPTCPGQRVCMCLCVCVCVCLRVCECVCAAGRSSWLMAHINCHHCHL